MSRPKKTPLERAAAAVAAIPAERRGVLRIHLLALRDGLRDQERAHREHARVSRSAMTKAELVKRAQVFADEGRDVRKLLALLDAIGGAS